MAPTAVPVAQLAMPGASQAYLLKTEIAPEQTGGQNLLAEFNLMGEVQAIIRERQERAQEAAAPPVKLEPAEEKARKKAKKKARTFKEYLVGMAPAPLSSKVFGKENSDLLRLMHPYMQDKTASKIVAMLDPRAIAAAATLSVDNVAKELLEKRLADKKARKKEKRKQKKAEEGAQAAGAPLGSPTAAGTPAAGAAGAGEEKKKKRKNTEEAAAAGEVPVGAGDPEKKKRKRERKAEEAAAAAAAAAAASLAQPAAAAAAAATSAAAAAARVPARSPQRPQDAVGPSAATGLAMGKAGRK